MDEELLAQFERKESEKATLASTDAEQYEAFRVVDRRQLSLHLRPIGEPYLRAQYKYLLYVVEAPSGTRLEVVFSFGIVTVKGRHLREIADAINNERCAYVQQFDAKQWPKPKDGSAPFVESLSYHMTMPQDVTGDKEAA